MRILQVFEPGTDGVFRHVEGLVKHLIQNGVIVDLCYSSIRSSPSLRCLVDTVKQNGGVTWDMQVGPAPCINDFKAVFKIITYYKRYAPDVVHLHSSKAGAIGRFSLCWCMSNRIIYTPNAYFGIGAGNSRFLWLYNNVERLLSGIGFTINVSYDEADWAIENIGLKRTRSLVIPNGVDTKKYCQIKMVDRRQARRKFGLGEESFVVGSIGRLCFQKNPILLLKSFAKILETYPDCYLLYVGAGDLNAEFEKLSNKLAISNKVIQFPMVDDVMHFYSAIDLFAMSSRYEGLSLALIEALSCSHFAVLTDVPGNREFRRYGFDGLWFVSNESEVEYYTKLLEAIDAIKNGALNNHASVVSVSMSHDVCYGKIMKEYEKLKNQLPCSLF